ncbi:60S acidic ribosomal protein P1 [Blomia tropicalis]|nr:60S acidic ribosomal protein P1 [Blomia tropicalis]
MAYTEPCYLSEGSIDMILEQKNDNLKPIVQILGSKKMANSRIRAVISDGLKMCQHCILLSEEIDKQYEDGLLSKFTVIRLEQYQISSLAKKDNLPVILVTRLAIVKKGEEVDRQVEPGQAFHNQNLISGAVKRDVKSANKPANTPNKGANQQTNDAATTSAETSILRVENVCPIIVITPFFNAWTIRVRVSNKSPIKTWSNARGNGKLFSFDCCDESGEVRITAFNNECERFFPIIEVNKVYLIARGVAKSANKQFSNLKNDYEITLNSNSIIEPCPESDIGEKLPTMRFKFIPLGQLNNLPLKSIIDVIGVIRTINPVDQLVSKRTGKELSKRAITLVDKSLVEVELTLWNESANDFEGEVGQIVAFKGVSVGEFQGRNLSAYSSTLIQLDPDIPETSVIRSWYNSEGGNQTFVSLARPKTEQAGLTQDTRYTCQLNMKNLNQQNQYFGIVGIIHTTNRATNQLYKACSNSNCVKKVTEQNDGYYNCPKCEKTSPNFVWNLMLSFQLTDATGGCWISLFKDQAETILGKTTNELAELFENDQNSYLFLGPFETILCRTISSKQPSNQNFNSRPKPIISTEGNESSVDFAIRTINKGIFPDIKTLTNRRGSGGRSSFSGLIVTVFGSTGFLARSVVNALARIGSTVICPYRGDPYMTRDLKLAGDLGQVWFVPFHLQDEDSIRRAVKYSNVVVNLIGRDHMTPNFSLDDVHVTGASRIARISREMGVKRFIHVSALNSCKKPDSFYVYGGSQFLKSKYYGELSVREQYPEATIIRPADIYGVKDKYLWYYCLGYRRNFRRLPLHNGGYGITKTPVSVSDVAQGIANAITDEESIGKTYDAVGPRRYELRMMMEYLQEIIMKTPENGSFKINNLRWDFLMRSRISLTTYMNKFVLRHPKVSWEKIERECVSDEYPKNPTLIELGVKLGFIEDNWPDLLVTWRYDFSYDGVLGEKKLFNNPPFISDGPNISNQI